MNLTINEIIENAKQDINDILEDLKATIVTQSAPSRLPINKTEKLQIISDYKRGASTESVAKKFSHYSVSQLAAIKAHITMNTY